MNIGRFAIRHKYFVLAFAIAIVLLGVYAKMSLKVQLSPDTNPPMATVMAGYPGASAQDVTKDVVEPMEQEFGKIEGISNIKSTSQDNLAIIQLEFNYGIDINEASIDVQNAISRIRGKLPGNMNEPKVLKFNTSDKPVMTISLSSESLSMEKIRQLVEDKIGYDIQLVEGVAAVNIFGGYNAEIQVELDKGKLDAYGISPQQVSNTLAQNNIKAPGGKLIEQNKEILLRIEEGFRSTEDIKSLKISLQDGNYVRLGEIANVHLTYEELESTYKFKGKNAIALLITKRSDANTIEVIDNVKGKLADLEKDYPIINFEVAQDDSIFTLQMVNNMTSSVLQSILLTIFIIMLFISAVNQSLVVSVSMPLVFLMTLGLMKFSGLKLDLVTLSALILSIGFVVDASIVVVENIMTHHTQQNKDTAAAAIDGTSEIALPSIAGALTTLVVLIPLVFIQGFVGAMFRPLSLTIIYAISSSIIVALVIIPLLTVLMSKMKWKRTERVIEIFSIPFNKAMGSLLEGYIKLLRIALNNKGKTFVVTLLLMVVSARFLMTNGVEMLPKFDSGVTYVSIEMEPGTTLQKTESTVGRIEEYLAKENNIIGYDTQVGFEKDSNLLGDFGAMGTNQALITINLNTRKEREETIWEFQERVRDNISRIPGIKRFVVKEQGGTAVSGSSAPLDVRISGEDQKILFALAAELEKEISKVEGTTNIYKSFHIDNLQINMNMDHARIQELGLNSAVISQQIFQAAEGIESTSIDTDEYENLGISIKYKDEFSKSMDAIMDSNIDTPLGIKVPLRELASIQIEKRSNIITRENLENTIEILGYTNNRAFSHIVRDINTVIDHFPTPKGYSIMMAGEQEELGNSMKDMMFLLLLAIVFVYLILVPQFKSFLHPITIMSAIPLVITGIAPALALSDKYVSMPVLLGFILLAGTVVNNAILLIDYVIARRDEQDTLEESLTAAVKARFRPIMMTALSDVTGMLPLALQLALGAERFSPLAITVTGGILAATLLTMIIIPVIYASFEQVKDTVRKRIAVS
ncbi:MAG: efflux RND transporter permease subunit [Bacillota bacterium]